MCEHNCVNIDGGYNCTCENEHALATDFYNCLGKLNLKLLIAIQIIWDFKLQIGKKRSLQDTFGNGCLTVFLGLSP